MSQHRILIVLSENGFAASATTDNGSPVPLDLDQLGEFVPLINAAAIAQIEALKTAHAVEIKDLQDRLAAASSPAVFSPILAELDAMFETLAEEIQTAFEVPYQTVRGLYSAGKTVRAYRFVEALTVPQELEATKAVILAKLAE